MLAAAPSNSLNPATLRKVRGIATRLLSQVVATLPPFLLLSDRGAGGLGLFSVFLALTGVSVLLEWGMPYRIQNAISRGDGEQVFDMRWLTRTTRFWQHLLGNLVIAVGLWQLTLLLLPILLPGQVAAALLGESLTVLGLYLVSALVGASYQGRSVLVGLSHTVTAFTLTLLGTTASVAMLLYGLHTGASIATLALLASTAPLVERVLSGWYCFMRGAPLRRHPSLPEPAGATQGMDDIAGWKVSAMFFYLQVLSLLGSNIDALYAVRTNSFELVGEYVFLSKLYGVPLLVTSILNTMAHPHLAATSRNDSAGATGVLWRVLRTNVAIIAGAVLVIIPSADWVYAYLTGKSSSMLMLSILLAVSTLCSVVRGSLSTYLYAEEAMTANIVGNTAFTASTVPLKIMLVDGAGIYGIVLANIASYVLFLLPFQLRYVWGRKRDQ